MKKLAFVVTLLFMGQAQAVKWNKENNPALFNPIMKNKINYYFHELPLKAEIQDHRYGWSETYWPSMKGGIAFRWNHPDPKPFRFTLLTKQQLMSLTSEELSRLSPAELYDIAMGDYSYTLTRRVLSMFKPTDLWWEGICHGWALAAINYPEPAKVVIKNKDGIQVPFGSSDVKGLISMHDAYNSRGAYARVGKRCSAKGKVKGEEDAGVPPVYPSRREAAKDECSDVNAGAFHLVLTAMIGLNSHGFVADVDRFNDVWNQPVTSYESAVVGDVVVSAKEMKRGIFRKVRVNTEMTYAEELVFYSPEREARGILGFVSKDPVTGTPAQSFSSRKYDYILELDRDGKIIGGEWISESRPDMIWIKSKDLSFNSDKVPLSGLNKIYVPIK